MTPGSDGMAEARCCECGYDFTYNRAFFDARRISPPRRCRKCRSLRRAATSELTGRVTSAGARFCVLVADDGREYISAPLPLPAFTLGAHVAFIGTPPGRGYGRGLAREVRLAP